MLTKREVRILSHFENVLDVASKIAIGFYTIPLNLIFFFSFFLISKISFFLTLTFGFLIFATHLILRKNKYYFNKQNFFGDQRTFGSIFRLFYILNLSISLSFYLLSYLMTELKVVLDEFQFSALIRTSGGIMFMLIYLFFGLILVGYLVRIFKNAARSIYVYLFIILSVIIFQVGLNLLSSEIWTQDVGLYFLGPINLLIIRILFIDNKTVSIHQRSQK